MAKRKKVKSPTGKPSKVNPAIPGLMRGEDVRGKRTSTYTVPDISKPLKKFGTAEKMDLGLPLKRKKR